MFSVKTAAPSADAKLAPAALPWVEKYRPRSIGEVASQQQVVDVLRSCCLSQNLPHLLFYGPPGTGKTSTILALARDLFKDQDVFKARVLELNASDDRGIQVVREKIKQFARVSIAQSASHSANGVPPYKIIVLDEADSMTADAQAALRRTMETYSKTTRFCLVCNYVSRIIEPLASRCAKFRFLPLPEEDAHARIQAICTSEGVQCAPNTIAALISVADGDLRRAIMLLQSAYRLHGPSDQVTPESIHELAGNVPDAFIDRMLHACESGNQDEISRIVTDAVCDGFPANRIVAQLLEKVIAHEHITERQKAHICIMFAEVDKRLTDGADEELQIRDALSRTSSIIKTM